MADGLQKPAVIEPIDPFQGGIFNRIDVTPWAAMANDLGLEEPDNTFRQGVIVGIPGSAYRRFYADLRQAIRVSDREILAAPVAVIVEPLPQFLA